MSEYSSKDDASLDDVIPEVKSTVMMSLDDLEPVKDVDTEVSADFAFEARLSCHFRILVVIV